MGGEYNSFIDTFVTETWGDFICYWAKNTPGIFRFMCDAPGQPLYKLTWRAGHKTTDCLEYKGFDKEAYDAELYLPKSMVQELLGMLIVIEDSPESPKHPL